MQTVLQDEDAADRNRRAQRENAVAQAVIAQRDKGTEMNEAEKFALAQITNKNYGRPLDYAGIIKYRAIEPSYFFNLPSDQECEHALGRKGKKS